MNLNTEDYYYPAPDAEAVLQDACGKEYQTTLDCVWGFEQIDTDESTAELCSTVTSFGVYKSKKLPQGIKQGPAIYQHLQDTAFDIEFKPTGEKLCNVFFDDTHMGDHSVEEHTSTIVRVLTVARMFNIQYRFTKCDFFSPKLR